MYTVRRNLRLPSPYKSVAGADGSTGGPIESALDTATRLAAGAKAVVCRTDENDPNNRSEETNFMFFLLDKAYYLLLNCAACSVFRLSLLQVVMFEVLGRAI